MEDHTSLVSLMTVVSIAFLVPILLHRFRLKMIPVVVAEILAGLVVGQSGLNWVHEDAWLELLSTFGFIYLMFLSGLEIDFASFRKRGRGSSTPKVNPVMVASAIFVLIFALSFGLAMLLSMSGLIAEPFLMTLIIATISLGVVVPVLKENKMIETPLGQTILLIAVISDLVTMILLAVYVSFESRNASQMWFLILFFLFVVATYYLLRRFAGRTIFEVLRRGTVQIGTRAVFALILFFVVLSERLNVEMILGAFLAGVIVSLLAPNKEFVRQLDSFGYGFLIPIFFVMIGVNLDLPALFNDPTILVLIPVLIAAIFVSKLVPVLVLKRWYAWREVAGAGILLSSTLSLVIAAAAVAVQVGIIDETMESALILVAVLTCILSPVLFNRVFPFQEPVKSVVAIVGANHITMPVTRDLLREGYEVKMFSTNRANDTKQEPGSRFPLVEVGDLDIKSLEQAGTFDADVVVFGTMEDEVNIKLANYAKSIGIERIILRVENPEKHEQLRQEESFSLLSTLYASRTLLKALIEYPSAVKLITQYDDSIQEVEMNNGLYHNTELRNLPFLGDTLILRIYRGDSFIIPHGTTPIKRGDRLLVSGNAETILSMKEHLE